MQSIIGASRGVLDHGMIKVIDIMGDDDAVVQAARTSTGKGLKTEAEDRSLIDYLMRHRHTTPFEMCEIKFYIKLPIFVARQWVRHRTARINEYSLRYSEATDELYEPLQENLACQSTLNKQGRGKRYYSDKDAEAIQDWIRSAGAQSIYTYEKLRSEYDLSRELARMVLPVNLYTWWYWKIDLHNLFNFLSLRMDKHAQFEIREYANIIADLVGQWVPASYQSFVEHRLNARTFSGREMEIIRTILDVRNAATDLEASTELLLTPSKKREFFSKLETPNERG